MTCTVWLYILSINNRYANDPSFIMFFFQNIHEFVIMAIIVPTLLNIKHTDINVNYFININTRHLSNVNDAITFTIIVVRSINIHTRPENLAISPKWT